MLRETGHLVAASVRRVDLVGHLGGGELLVLLLETGEKEAGIVARRMQESVNARIGAAGDEQGLLPVRIGMAVCEGDGEDSKELIDRAIVGLGDTGPNP